MRDKLRANFTSLLKPLKRSQRSRVLLPALWRTANASRSFS